MLHSSVGKRTILVVEGALLCLLLGTGIPANATGAPDRTAHRRNARPAGKPAYVWLLYADGNPTPQGGPMCTGMRPPPFTPPSGVSLDDWQRQVQAYLDPWYADFNLLFTLTRPPGGDYYTMIISSNGKWCQQAPEEGGIAWSTCDDYPGQIAYALQCAGSAHGCATIIAHEHGHMVGLMHTTNTHDVMNRMVRVTAAGFDDNDNVTDMSVPPNASTVIATCNTQEQNSHQLMLTRLGPWSGGTKPSLFPSNPDAGAGEADAAPVVGVDAAQVGTPIGNRPPIIEGDGGITVLAGFDPLTRPPMPVVEPVPKSPSSQRSGCNMVHADSRLPMYWVALLALMAARRKRSDRSATAARGRAARRP